MMRAIVVRGERGNVLLSALVLIFVITTLGLALFELSLVESRSSFFSQREARAFEIAQAGVERALARLLLTILDEPIATASWADGDSTVAPTAICTGVGGCVDNEFRAAASTYIGNTTFDGGSYAISFKLLKVAEASSNPYGQRCLPDTVTTTLCANLIFVRSTGTMPELSGYTASRTIQLLAQAQPPFTGVTAGLRTGGPTGRPISGNACIAGSINVIGANPGTASLSFGTGACQRNNWAALDSASLDRLTPLQPVCPPGRTCSCGSSPASNCVYSLGATLRVALPTTTAVVLSSTAYLGQSQTNADSDTAYHSPSLHGKGPLDATFVAGGCVMPCTDNYTGVTVGTNTVVDGNNVTRPYLSNPTPSFPLLTDSVQISGGSPSSYTHYACPPNNSVGCTSAANNGARDYSSTTEFFLNHAYRVGCTGLNTPSAGCRDNDDYLVNRLGSTSGLRDNTPAFRYRITFYNRSGTLTNGEICWRRNRITPATDRGGSLPEEDNTLEFGIGWWDKTLTPNDGCGNPSTPQNPLLIYMENLDFTITSAPNINYFFRGAAIFLVTGVVRIDESWYPCRDTTSCSGQTFPQNHLFAVLTPSNMEITRDNSDTINAIFGFFYTASNFYADKTANIVGSMTASRFCFAGGCSSPSVKVPRLFEVPYNPHDLPAEMFVWSSKSLGSFKGWTVSSVRGFWLECRPGATSTNPATVTGVCGYS